jgi:hypothetical protein
MMVMMMMIMILMRYRSWLRYYATSRKVAASNPDKVMGFLNLPNSCRLNTVLESNQSLTEMMPGTFLWGKDRPGCKSDNLTAICEPIV